MKKPDILTNTEYYGIVGGTLLIVLAGIWIPMNTPPTNFVNWIAIIMSVPALVIGIYIEIMAIRKIKNKFLILENKIKNKKIDPKISKDDKTQPNELNNTQNFDTKIVALGIAVISGLIYTRIFENEFFKDVILLAIPSLLGLFGTKWITNQWQIRSAKIKMKKEILEFFAKSAQYQSNTIHQFVGLFGRMYGKADKEKYDLETGKTTFTSSIPLTGDERPKIKLHDDYEKMNQRFEESKLSDEIIFISLLRLYYRDEILVNEYVEIQIKIGYIRNIMYELMQDPNEGEYKKLLDNYEDKRSNIKSDLKNFSKKIVEKDITV